MGFAAVSEHASFFSLLTRLNPSLAVALLQATFSPMDLLFYGIAVYEGYHFSFQPLTDAELARLKT